MFKLVMQMYCTNQQKAAWFESDFCVSSDSSIATLLTMDLFSKILVKKSDILPKYH